MAITINYEYLLSSFLYGERKNKSEIIENRNRFLSDLSFIDLYGILSFLCE